VQIGDAERGDIYVIDAAAPAAAIAAVQMGAAELIESCTPHASEAEIEAATQRRWEEARKLGGEAMLKFLGLMENS
jgi:hypothetical protein